MDHLIRRAVPADAYRLAALRWEFKTEDRPSANSAGRDEFVARCADWIRGRVADDSWLVWVAEVDGTIRGNLCLCRVEKLPGPEPGSTEFGYVTNFYVAPGYRGRGLGGALLTHVREHAQRAALDTLVVWPSPRSVPLYRRAGFGVPAELLELPVEPS